MSTWVQSGKSKKCDCACKSCCIQACLRCSWGTRANHVTPSHHAPPTSMSLYSLLLRPPYATFLWALQSAVWGRPNTAGPYHDGAGADLPPFSNLFDPQGVSQLRLPLPVLLYIQVRVRQDHCEPASKLGRGLDTFVIGTNAIVTPN